MNQIVEYDDKTSRYFALATIFWGIIGMFAGVLLAAQLSHWSFNFNSEFLSFGRVRPIHTNAVIFAFGGNAIFCAIYYSSQRLLKARMFSDILSKIHFWGWQLIIVAAAISLALGKTTGKEYAELEWPIDIAIAVVWVIFAINFFGAIYRRREKHLYVAIWFYIATIITVAVLHIVNSIELPVSFMKSYPVYAGVQDALVQWWYGHNAVAFFLTTPFLGLMYYFIPKASGKPIYSYRLSIIHFWSLVFIYIWAGPHHLHYTSLPDWAQNLGMIFSLMLIAPSWGGMLNGLLTLKGAWHLLRTDPVIKFMVVAVTFYGMATLEGPLMSIKAVNAISHYTDWTIGHVHSGTLGWNGFITFGMLYYLVPRLWNAKGIYSIKLANLHFWIGLVGIVLYVVPLWFGGVTQALMWKSITPEGTLTYPNFMETVTKMLPFYYVRLLGGLLYFVGAVIMVFNLYKTIKMGQGIEIVSVKVKDEIDTNPSIASGHSFMESKSFIFTVCVFICISIGGIVQMVPAFLIKSNVPTIASVKPYTPLELEGRDIYLKEGCYTCHSQMVRPFKDEVIRYGEYSKPGEFIYDHPFQWGSRRIGPDLARLGGKYNHLWHLRHMENPRSTSPGSLMPSYPHLIKTKINYEMLPTKLNAMKTLGVPYSDQDIISSVDNAKKQAKEIETELKKDYEKDVSNSEMLALIAYLQRLGVDIQKENVNKKEDY